MRLFLSVKLIYLWTILLVLETKNILTKIKDVD